MSLPNTIQCPHCGQAFSITPEQVPQYAGQTITCTKCQRPFTVPAPGGPMMAYASPASQYLQPQQGNGMAVASLICGLLGFCVPVIASIPAIIFGILGLNKTRDPRVGGKGLAVGGIVLGGVSLVMFPLLISILLPALNAAKERANRVKCASNLRMIGQGIALYHNDFKATPSDIGLLVPHAGLSTDTFVCPSTTDTPPTMAAPNTAVDLKGHCSYVFLKHKQSDPADKVVAYEPLTNHRDGINVLFNDGHVDFFSRPQAQQIIQNLSAGKNPPLGPGR